MYMCKFLGLVILHFALISISTKKTTTTKTPVFCCPTPEFVVMTRTFLRIFRQALLKTGSLFYIDYVKKYTLNKRLFLPNFI